MKIKWKRINSKLWIAEGIGEVERDFDGWYFHASDEIMDFGPFKSEDDAKNFGREYSELLDRYLP